MPLLFEIKDQDKILCFVPRGHRVGGSFVDLPKQIAQTCAFDAAYRLLSMCYTQTDIDMEESSILSAVNSFKDELFLIEVMQILVDDILNKLLRKPLSETHLQSIIRTLCYNDVKIILGEEYFSDENFRIICSVILNKHLNNLKKHCSTLGNKIIAILSNPKRDAAEIEPLINNYFFELQLEVLKKFTNIPAISKYITEMNFEAIPDQLPLLNKFAMYKNLLWEIYLNENHFLTHEFDPKKIVIDQYYISFLLGKYGPFLAGGKIGQVYYGDAKPIPYGKLGSVDLYAFPKSAYNEDSMQSHIVLVIGVVKDKIIFLDSVFDSKINGPRQAYVMSVQTFIERTIEHGVTGRRDTCRFFCIDPIRIDTSEKLMFEHTKPLSSPTQIQPTPTNPERASMSPRPL